MQKKYRKTPGAPPITQDPAENIDGAVPKASLAALQNMQRNFARGGAPTKERPVTPAAPKRKPAPGAEMSRESKVASLVALLAAVLPYYGGDAEEIACEQAAAASYSDEDLDAILEYNINELDYVQLMTDDKKLTERVLMGNPELLSFFTEHTSDPEDATHARRPGKTVGPSF